MAFPIDRVTGNSLPIKARIELRAPDFIMKEDFQEIMLSPKTDSGKLIFGLAPRFARARAILHVVVRQHMPDGGMVTLGASSLTTEIIPTGIRLAAQVSWTIATLPLSAIALKATERESLPRELLAIVNDFNKGVKLGATREIVRIKTGEARLAPTKASHVIYYLCKNHSLREWCSEKVRP